MDIEKFKSFLLDGKTQEAQKLLEEFLTANVSVREQGQVLIALSSMYMEMENSLNREHLLVLKNAMAQLSELQKRKNQLTDGIKLIKVRKELGNN